jgi:chromosome partitioning protein
MWKIISFFNHKGWVWKTTLVHNLGFALADLWKKVLLIDADPQMNLTAAMYGLSTSMEYSTDEDSKWMKYTAKYISISEYIDKQLKNTKSDKTIWRTNAREWSGFVDMISGSINLTNIEADIYGIVRNRNDFTKDIPLKFEQSIKIFKETYDYILIDTSPSASSVVNALMIMSSDFWIAPVSPSFFSLQAIDNLKTIFKNWLELLRDFEWVQGYPWLSLNVKFLGLVIQKAKRFKGYSAATEWWINDINKSVKEFHRYALDRGRSLPEDIFKEVFWKNSTPFIIAKCCDFTDQLRWLAERSWVPVIYLTQDMCWSKADITSESTNAQYARSFKSINESYRWIAADLIKL